VGALGRPTELDDLHDELLSEPGRSEKRLARPISITAGRRRPIQHAKTAGLVDHVMSELEEPIGPGGFQATRGHGDITARIQRGGTIRVGDLVRAV
jgi:hypothetical protein